MQEFAEEVLPVTNTTKPIIHVANVADLTFMPKQYGSTTPPSGPGPESTSPLTPFTESLENNKGELTAGEHREFDSTSQCAAMAQLGIGWRWAESITTTSSIAFLASSLRPSCSCKAVSMGG